MSNAYVNAFVAMEPSSGEDGFSTRQAPRKPAAFLEGRVGVNRLFRSNLAYLPNVEEAPEAESDETATFVLDQFLNRPKMA